MKTKSIIVVVVLIISFLGCNAQNVKKQASFTEFAGLYFGQDPPGKTPVLFAPEFFNAEHGYHFPVIFSPDLSEAFWKPMERGNTGLLYSKMLEGSWTPPQRIDFGLEKGIGDACFSPDGNKLFFLSFQAPNSDDIERERIWFVERKSSGWSEPKLIDEVICSHPTHWTFSVASNGNLYFTSEIEGVKGEQDIYVAHFESGKYRSPISVGNAINTDAMEFGACIAPDESYLIFTRIGENTKETDLYISFKNIDGSWTNAIEMGPNINSIAHDNCTYVSWDGKYLFFISQRERMNGIYWVDAKIIEELTPKNLTK